jgi:hypothetical protein
MMRDRRRGCIVRRCRMGDIKQEGWCSRWVWRRHSRDTGMRRERQYSRVMGLLSRELEGERTGFGRMNEGERSMI